MNEPAYKYKIIWRHDGVVEELYALDDESLNLIISSINAGRDHGVYKNSEIEVIPLK